MKRKREKGITLVALTITIIVLSIIASITINTGGNIIESAKLENLKTNMLLIQAKTKEYVEEVNFKKGPVDTAKIETIRNEVYVVKGGLVFYESEEVPKEVKDLIFKVSNETGEQYYYVSRSALDKAGLSKVEEGEDNGYYVVKFDEENITVEVYNTMGFENNGQNNYSLTQLEQIEEVK